MAEVSYLSQEQAQKVDEILMGSLSFSIDQLMELAGLSVASAITKEYNLKDYNKVLIICGPGNNGGDGLVAGRHLKHFGYTPTVWYPKPTQKPLYQNLVQQLKSLGIEILDKEQVEKELEAVTKLKDRYNLVLDSIFGFSFKGDPRPPFDKVLKVLTSKDSPPIASVDCPSGWHVEDGPNQNSSISPLQPDMLISLTAPKLGAKYFTGPYHYLGGRFVPPQILEEFKLNIPNYPGAEQCVKLPSQQGTQTQKEAVQNMRISYEAGELTEDNVDKNPLIQFDRWFQEALQTDGIVEANAMCLSTADSNGRVSSRYVLNKGFDENGFVFYTNYGSQKAQQLQDNPKASLCFYWEPLQRSVRIEGNIEKISAKESEAYFQSRPRGSQIGAWVSSQSQAVKNGRTELEKREKEIEEKFQNQNPLPLPPFWGGYRIKPNYIEFWQGRQSRLHDRILFTKSGSNDWSLQRLWP